MTNNYLSRFILIISLMTISILSLIVAYYKGTSDALLFEVVLAANENIHTIKSLDIGKYDEIRQMHSMNLSANIAAIEDIRSNDSNIFRIPAAVIRYWNLVSSGKDEIWHNADLLIDEAARINLVDDAIPSHQN